MVLSEVALAEVSKKVKYVVILTHKRKVSANSNIFYLRVDLQF